MAEDTLSSVLDRLQKDGGATVGVVERQQRIEDIMLIEGEKHPVTRLVDVTDDVGMGEHRPLLRPGGAAGEENRRQCIFIEGYVVDLSLRCHSPDGGNIVAGSQ